MENNKKWGFILSDEFACLSAQEAARVVGGGIGMSTGTTGASVYANREKFKQRELEDRQRLQQEGKIPAHVDITKDLFIWMKGTRNYEEAWGK